jgi:hypothetical protein
MLTYADVGGDQQKGGQLPSSPGLFQAKYEAICPSILAKPYGDSSMQAIIIRIIILFLY